jgi:hypothetical protein
MSSLNDILAKLKDADIDPASKEAIDTFAKDLSEAKSSNIGFVKENAQQLQEWLDAVASGDLDVDEFKHLVESQKKTIEQNTNTLNIEAQVQVKRLSIDLLAMGVSSVAPVIPPGVVKSILKKI